MMKSEPHIIDVTADTFMTEVIEKSKQTPVILDFWAPWCEPCKSLTPILHAIVEKHPSALVLAKVNTDSEQMLAQQMGIQSLPTVALLKDGQIVDNFMGVKPESEIITWLSEHIELTEADEKPLVDNNIQALIDNQQYDEALGALLLLPPEQAVWQTIDVHLLMNNATAAQKVFDGLSDEQLKMPKADQAKAKIKLAGIDVNDELGILKEQIAQGQVEAAIIGLLDLLRKDLGNTDLKQLLIVSFSLLNDPKLAAKYRSTMGSLLN